MKFRGYWFQKEWKPNIHIKDHSSIARNTLSIRAFVQKLKKEKHRSGIIFSRGYKIQPLLQNLSEIESHVSFPKVHSI